MDRKALLERMIDCGIVGVVRTSSAETALKAVEAVMAGGMNAVEITFTVPNAVDVIRTVAKSIGPDIILGAGTVTDMEKAKAAIDAGARFIVAPNTDRETIMAAVARGAVAIPGALTPTEVVNAVAAGADAVKIFPASAFGPSYIKALRGPLPDVVYVPTGGVELDDIPAYLEAGAKMFGVGSNLVDKKLIDVGDYATITKRARAFIDAVKTARAAMKKK